MPFYFINENAKFLAYLKFYEKVYAKSYTDSYTDSYTESYKYVHDVRQHLLEEGIPGILTLAEIGDRSYL